MTSGDTGGESTGLSPRERNYHAKPADAADSSSRAPASDDFEEKTEVIYGEEKVVESVLRILSTVTKSLDMCGDRYGPSILLLNEQIKQMYIDLHNRGGKERCITEITEENIMHCKELMKFQELRHLDGLKGYLSIADGRLFTSHAFGQEGKTLTHMVTSTVRVFVEQQQYFFETLWNKAIPAKQRIREIEEGAKREFVETIRDSTQTEKIGFDLIKNAQEEILLLFSKPNAFFLQEKTRGRRGRGRVLALIKEAAASPRNVKVRILIPIITSDVNNNNNDTDAMTIIANEKIISQQQLKELGIDVRRITQKHQENFLQNNSSNSNLTLLIVDQSSYLTVELNDDDDDDNTKEETSAAEEDAIILATYSNSEATVFAYVSIFENLWMKTQI
jgi:hypothetical protein